MTLGLLLLQIRKVHLHNGKMKTVLGKDGQGADTNSGDGGQATAATVKAPTGITVAHNGDVYFSTW